MERPRSVVPPLRTASSRSHMPSSFTVTNTGYPISSITETGALPGGVAFRRQAQRNRRSERDTGHGRRLQHQLQGAEWSGSPATQSFTLSVNQPAAITSTNSGTFTIGILGSFTVTTAGIPTTSISESRHLPNGITFTDNGNGTGTLSGAFRLSALPAVSPSEFSPLRTRPRLKHQRTINHMRKTIKRSIAATLVTLLVFGRASVFHQFVSACHSCRSSSEGSFFGQLSYF